MKKIIGLGNALVDIMTQLHTDSTLVDLNFPKGSMQLVDDLTSTSIDQKTSGMSKSMSAGGSAANTINGLANLGLQTSFIGKVGKDELGDLFGSDMNENNISPKLLTGKTGSGRAIGLISPDTERTFATYLGAAIELGPEDLSEELFSGYGMLHIEGYLVQNQALVKKAVQLAKALNLIVSIDLASFNVVANNKEFLHEIIRDYVDVVFANEEEAKAFTNLSPEEALNYISNLCEIAIVKLGPNGSLIKKNHEQHKVGVIQVNPLDTTGAGDLYASGFLYGLVKGLPLNKCGEIGAVLSGHVIEVIGSKMDQKKWELIREKVSKIEKRN
ncbi:adenosine kinase [Bacteroidota bacterium]